MKPFDKLEENYFPKGIELLEYMENLAVQYVPDIDIDNETGENIFVVQLLCHSL